MTPISTLRDLYRKWTFAANYAEETRAARNAQRERSHLATCAENVNAEDQHDAAIDSRNDARYELERAMHKHLLPLLSVAEAAKEYAKSIGGVGASKEAAAVCQAVDALQHIKPGDEK